MLIVGRCRLVVKGLQGVFPRENLQSKLVESHEETELLLTSASSSTQVFMVFMAVWKSSGEQEAHVSIAEDDATGN
jgi:hypothetical protein